MPRPTRFGPLAATALAMLLPGMSLAQQYVPSRDAHTPGEHFTPNIHVASHIPLGAPLTVADIEIEQELDRPYAYVARRLVGGFDLISLEDPDDAEVIYRWRIENAELHQGSGPMDVKYFKLDGRYYLILSVQFRGGGPSGGLGAIVFDVTSLPDTSGIREVGRIEAPEFPGGFHNIFAYKHSNGRPLLFATTAGPYANVYDLGYVLEGRSDDALVARVPVPTSQAIPGSRGYHDFYTGYHADSEQDRFYGGGTGGYYVYNITDLENPELLVSLTGIRGVERGHTFTPSPDGRYVIAETEYQYAPLRIFDLKPGLDGEVANINRPISAWTANWEHLVHNHEVRWPFVFVSGYVDGLQVFTLSDPKNPKTIAHYYTYLEGGDGDGGVMNGAWGVDVRNADGLIVISDMVTGLWAFRMEGFNGWNGLDWGYPNISSVQDWENGPAYQARSRN